MSWSRASSFSSLLLTDIQTHKARGKSSQLLGIVNKKQTVHIASKNSIMFNKDTIKVYQYTFFGHLLVQNEISYSNGVKNGCRHSRPSWCIQFIHNMLPLRDIRRRGTQEIPSLQCFLWGAREPVAGRCPMWMTAKITHITSSYTRLQSS